MSDSLKEYLVSATQKAAEDLKTAVGRLPEDKRAWSPMDKGRTALDQVAECALINGHSVEMIKSRAWTMGGSFDDFDREKAEAAKDWDSLQKLLDENTAKVIAAIEAVSPDQLGDPVELPWATMTLAQIVAYPFWNMSYHEGQINYIASMLGCL